MKQKVKLFWAAFFVIFCIWVSFFMHSQNMRLENIRNYTWDNLALIWWVFLLIYSLRIYLFIPSTLIIIALWIISKNIEFTFIISMIGVWIWLIEAYFIWYFLHLQLPDSKIPKRIQPYIKKVSKKWFLYILVWCFFPVFPTDVICYASGFIRYNFKKFLLAGLLWESVLVFLYSYIGIEAEKYIIPLTVISTTLIVLYLIYFYFKKRGTFKLNLRK